MKDSIRVATPNATKADSKTTAKWEETPEINIIKELTFVDEDFEDVNPDDTELSKFNFNL
jgi:hypothetical protein